MLMGTVSKTVHLESCQDLRTTPVLQYSANSLHGLEDYVLHLCVVKSGHLALQTSDDVLAPLAVRGISSMAFAPG